MLREIPEAQCPMRLQQQTTEVQADAGVDEETILFIHIQDLEMFFQLTSLTAHKATTI